ncbi:MAG: hypothetical protein J3R72DRAFT_480873 [Linnemannia gamsii]|nr:MAG: hypothetical protein J3R72DRAFT_480873 [Linnemannia gamsii]
MRQTQFRNDSLSSPAQAIYASLKQRSLIQFVKRMRLIRKKMDTERQRKEPPDASNESTTTMPKVKGKAPVKPKCHPRARRGLVCCEPCLGTIQQSPSRVGTLLANTRRVFMNGPMATAPATEPESTTSTTPGMESPNLHMLMEPFTISAQEPYTSGVILRLSSSSHGSYQFSTSIDIHSYARLVAEAGFSNLLAKSKAFYQPNFRFRRWRQFGYTSPREGSQVPESKVI